MRRLYSNPNNFRRTLNFSHVHNSDLAKLATPDQLFAEDVRRGKVVRAAVQEEDLTRNAVESAHHWNKLLQKARRLHRERPKIPEHVRETMARLGLNPPRV